MRPSSLLTLHDIITVRGSSFRLTIPSLTVTSGHILSITGPNGSGKSTILEHISGILPLQKGSISLNGKELDSFSRIRADTGFIPDDDTWFIEELCAREYFSLLAATYHKAGTSQITDGRIAYLCRTLLFTMQDIPIRQLSHGNKKKVQIIAGIMHRPALIIIDELRNGLDPLAIIQAERLLSEESKRGAAIITATHDLWWAQRISQEVVMLINGSIAMHAPMPDILAQYDSLEAAFMKMIEATP